MKNDGGAAFPHDAMQLAKGMEGMSLRDWFAGMALAGEGSHPQCTGDVNDMAAWAYKMADAMLQAREK